MHNSLAMQQEYEQKEKELDTSASASSQQDHVISIGHLYPCATIKMAAKYRMDYLALVLLFSFGGK